MVDEHRESPYYHVNIVLSCELIYFVSGITVAFLKGKTSKRIVSKILSSDVRERNYIFYLSKIGERYFKNEVREKRNYLTKR